LSIQWIFQWVFFKDIWMANGSTHLSVFCKAGGEFEGFPGERSRFDLR